VKDSISLQLSIKANDALLFELWLLMEVEWYL